MSGSLVHSPDGLVPVVDAAEVASKLADALAEVEALKAESAELTRALTGLTCGGSEFFIRKGGRYVADIKACVDWVRRRDRDAHNRFIDATLKLRALEAATPQLTLTKGA